MHFKKRAGNPITHYKVYHKESSGGKAAAARRLLIFCVLGLRVLPYLERQLRKIECMGNRNHTSGNGMVTPAQGRSVRKPAGLTARGFRMGAGILFLLLAWMAGPPGLGAEEYRKLEIAADVKSRFSDGCSSIQELMTQAEVRGLDGLIFGDHDRKSIQYGVPYLERVLRIKMDSPSLLSNGAATFLSEINQLDQSDDTVVLVPGVESAPFYYWQGNPLDGNLVAHNWDKHLLVVGLPSSLDYDEIPTLNSSFTTRYLKDNLFIFLIFVVSTIVGLRGFMGKSWRGAYLLFALVMALFAANTHPFKSSPFDPYRDWGVEPYQHLIDYANSKGAMVFWNHLETPVAEKIDNSLFDVHTRTERHPADLLVTRGYTGFQAMNETPVTAVDPGREWDQVLRMYLIGAREKPVWGYGANDFHCEATGPNKLGAVRTVLLAKQKNRASVLEALRAGRMYAVKHKQDPLRLSLDTFELVDSATGQRAVMGETLKTKNSPDIGVRLSTAGGKSSRAHLRLIRNGQVVKQAVLNLPYEGVWQDPALDLSRPAYYRLMVEIDDQHQLVSNPIFFDPGTLGQPGLALARLEPSPKSAPMPAAPAEPQAAPPSVPKEKVTAPKIQLSKPEAAPQYAEVTARGVRLRKGPSTKFPVAGQAKKGERLVFVRRTKMMYKGKAWIIIKQNGNQAYVWEGLVKVQ